MDAQQVLAWQRDVIANIISDSGFSVMRIARETGIPQTTLVRRLKGVSEFRPSELFRIAKYLHRDPALFVPPIFRQQEVAA
ncbi:MAG: helix-turn-helix domain-containing protein [Bifidobacterium tibiigranuli]|jgi:predicted transcriptional regulator|uniref:helix-turn-helix domain-containing protein n=1 Tax=Bifidobacterium tibiigranuli TaxID=2172043 RepID=UPI0026EDD1B2|nr:helix-turn-helix domain-containing protein [Bifidobacterium tibiigranuli]MCI1673181.1 helix-turn-helix domain-containing protein [Bifidobacterium tibiigranuli]MCI1713574.1 helix-turn-helix domain-containing protein [Bifidobacterium tibiigranuli]